MSVEKGKSGTPRGRIIALVIAATGLAYIGVQAFGSIYGWSNRTMAFFDLVALALFAWALIETFLIWRRRQSDKES
ncbi:MAG: DUF5337 domain-containing protein [Pseudomonadota bacterium]